MRGVRLPQEELLAQFPISKRLASRVLFLLKEGVVLSPGVLEAATPSSSLEDLLLSRSLRDVVKKKDWEKLEKLVREFSEEVLLLKDLDSGEKLLLLEDEEAAEEAEKELGLVPLEEKSILPFSSTPQISGRDRAQLFTPHVIAQLKMELFTSSNPDVRIEALRKLTLSGISRGEKKRILLSVLYDKDEEVRLEALEAMTMLGLSSEWLELLKPILRGEEKEALEGMTRILQRIPSSHEGEDLVILGCMLRALELTQAVEVKTAVLEFFSQWCPKVVLDSASLLNVVKQIFRLQERENFQILEKIRQAVVSLASSSPLPLCSYLKEQIESLPPSSERTLYLRILFDLSKDLPKSYYYLVLEEELDRYFQRQIPLFWFFDVLLLYSEESFSYLLDKLSQLSHQNLVLGLELVEELLQKGDFGKKEEKQFYQKVIQILPISLLATVGWILRSPLMQKGKMTKQLKEKLVRSLLYHLHPGQLEEFRQSVLEFIASKGDASVRPLLQFLTDRAVPETLRRETGETLVQVLKQLDSSKKTHRRTFEKVVKSLLHHYLETSPPLPHGYLAILLGQIALVPLISKEMVHQIYQALMNYLGRHPHGLQILIALSSLAGSPHLEEEAQEKVTRLFLHLLGHRWKGRGAIALLEHGEITFYEDVLGRIHTELLPHLLEGLKHLAKRSQGARRFLILQVLLVKWEKISRFEEVWTPFNIEHLLKVFEVLLCDTGTPLDMVEKITDKLLTYLEEREDFVVVPTLAAILGKRKASSLARQASRFSKKLMEVVKEREVSGELDLSLEKIYQGIATLLAKGYYSLKSSQGVSLFNILVKAFREKREGSREALLTLYQESEESRLRQEAGKILGV